MNEIKIASKEDAAYIASNIRKADKIEFYKVSGDNDYIKSIHFGMDSEKSITYCLSNNKTPMALVGCIEMQDYQVVWACGTNQVKKFGRFFVSATRELLEKHKINRKPYINYVDCENLNAVRYLKHVGFQLLDPIPHGKMNANFYPFIMG